MGAKERNTIITAIKKIGKADAFEIYSGNVTAIDTNTLTCTVNLHDDITVSEVRLKATIDNSTNGCFVIPKINSHVKIALLDGGVEFSLLQASEIDKYMVKIGNRTFEIDATAHVFDGGNNKGMVKVVPLTQRLNAVENKLNQVINILKDTVIPLAPSGTYPLSTNFGTVPLLPNTQQADIENPNVKH